MRRLIFTVSIFALIYTTASQAITERVELSPPHLSDVSAFNVNMRPNGIFEIQEDTVFYPKQLFYNGEAIDAGELLPEDKPFIALNRSEPISVEFLLNGDVAIDLLLTKQEAGEIPERIVISSEDFEKASIDFLEEGGVFDLYAGYSVYQDQKEAARNGGTQVTARAHYAGYGGCVAYVCKRVGCSGTVGNGRGMVSYLISKKGWHSVSCSNPKKGDVASWKGGSHGKGHCAIWNGSGWCYDQGCFDPGKKYKKTGCARK